MESQSDCSTVRLQHWMPLKLTPIDKLPSFKTCFCLKIAFIIHLITPPLNNLTQKWQPCNPKNLQPSRCQACLLGHFAHHPKIQNAELTLRRRRKVARRKVAGGPSKGLLKKGPSQSDGPNSFRTYIYAQRLGSAQALQRRGFPFTNKWRCKLP